MVKVFSRDSLDTVLLTMLDFTSFPSGAGVIEIRDKRPTVAMLNFIILLFYNILSDCHNSDEIYYLLNAFRLDKKIFLINQETIHRSDHRVNSL